MPQVAIGRGGEPAQRQRDGRNFVYIVASYLKQTFKVGSPPALVLGWWPTPIVLVLARVGRVVGHSLNKNIKKKQYMSIITSALDPISPPTSEASGGT